MWGRTEFGRKVGSEEGRERKSKREVAGWKEEHQREERMPQLVCKDTQTCDTSYRLFSYNLRMDVKLISCHQVLVVG